MSLGNRATFRTHIVEGAKWVNSTSCPVRWPNTHGIHSQSLSHTHTPLSSQIQYSSKIICKNEIIYLSWSLFSYRVKNLKILVLHAITQLHIFYVITNCFYLRQWGVSLKGRLELCLLSVIPRLYEASFFASLCTLSSEVGSPWVDQVMAPGKQGLKAARWCVNITFWPFKLIYPDVLSL